MRWRQSFMAEASEALQHLGMRACPVCGCTESLSMSHFPVLLVDAGFPADADGVIPGGEREDDVTSAVKIECATCGHLMLFNAQRYRTGDEKILERELTDEYEE